MSVYDLRINRQCEEQCRGGADDGSCPPDRFPGSVQISRTRRPSSLVLGMLLGLARSWPARLIGLVLAFGAGALVSAVSFELFDRATEPGAAIEQKAGTH